MNHNAYLHIPPNQVSLWRNNVQRKIEHIVNRYHEAVALMVRYDEAKKENKRWWHNFLLFEPRYLEGLTDEEQSLLTLYAHGFVSKTPYDLVEVKNTLDVALENGYSVDLSSEIINMIVKDE